MGGLHLVAPGLEDRPEFFPNEMIVGPLPAQVVSQQLQGLHNFVGLWGQRLRSPTQALTPKSYEIVKALELLAYHLGWQWTNNHLIREKLWPILKAWSHQVQQAAHAATGPQTGSGQNKPVPTGIGHCVQSPADASACAAMKVIGDVAGLGLDSHKESVCELLKMLAAVLQQPSASVPWTVQVFTAEAVLCLSPSNPTFALEVTQKWRRQAQFAPPMRIEDKLCMLEKIVGAIHSVSK
ncbi:little elongation complex subunit 1-like [Patiria miniata]|uniref:Little elongation complex subunit 1 C-terminal domain-containing protein n=1 Tax=Patiria miniata TaxID=46514 RepID=A0A913ZMI0_PATMI|nr:little elongation complex subunit 1-like [Patiria miniata]